MVVGRPSLYTICQYRYEEHFDIWDEWRERNAGFEVKEVEPEFVCICGYQMHTIQYAGTPLLFKKGDELKIEVFPPRMTDMVYQRQPVTIFNEKSGKTMAFYGVQFEPRGLMPRDWVSPQMDGIFTIMGKVSEALGKTITE